MPSLEDKARDILFRKRISAEEPPVRELVRIELLGGFRVSVGMRLIREEMWRLRKAAGLVKLLALEPGHCLQRDQVMDVLWPNLGPKAATNNLYQALYVARRTLDLDPRHLALHDGRLALCPDGPLRVDVEIFEAAAEAARRNREPAAYRAALDLYAGDLLPADRYERWAESRREGLRSLYVALLVELAYLYEDRGEGRRAVETFERAVTAEPTREEAHLGLMHLYATGGQALRAIVQYGRLQTILQSELSGEPGTATRRLYREILSGRLPAASPPTPSEDVGSRRHNLPAKRSTFVGREGELAQIKRTLPMTGLLTLTGAGGCGKTRLALEAGRDLASLYPDGAWLVELAPLSERTLVAQALAGILGVRERPGRSLAETLVDHLRTKNLLLILDNCEHLVEEVAALVDALLDACPRLRILATSREALRVPGEVVRPVQPLSVPGVDGSPGHETLTGYESVRLFVERAQQRLPAFTLTPENARPVAEVCRKLDGIPLAIELATARMATLAVEQLADRMDDSLELLTVGNRTVEPRRRTLRAALDWSHELLSEPERVLFRRLSVFAGGFSLEAAEAVGAVGNVGRGSEALNLLSQLAEKSLVNVEESRRFRLLEPVRLYGQERLEESDETQGVRGRHAEHYLAFAEEADLVGPDQAEWLERLEADLANLRAALSWFLAGGCVEEGTRLAAALGARFWNMCGPSEGRDWLERGLGGCVVLPAALRARALNELGFIAMCLADYPRMTEAFEEGLTLTRELGDERGIAMSLGPLRFAALHGKNEERLAALERDAEAGYRKVADPWARGYLAISLGFAAAERGEFQRSAALHEEALALFSGLGDLRSIAMCLNALGMTYLQRGRYVKARPFFEEDLRLLRRLGEKVGIQQGLLGMAAVFGACEHPARAARLWGAEEALREALGLPLWGDFPTPYGYEGRLAAARSLLDEDEWESAWARGRAMTSEEAIEHALSEEDALSAPEAPPVAGGSEPLTPREREVAGQVARGLTNRQVAGELSVSERTVHTHVRRILRKLDLTSRSQITAWAIEHRLLEDDG